MILFKRNAVKYINNMGFSDIIIDVIKFTTVRLLKMEMSVGFADKGRMQIITSSGDTVWKK